MSGQSLHFTESIVYTCSSSYLRRHLDMCSRQNLEHEKFFVKYEALLFVGHETIPFATTCKRLRNPTNRTQSSSCDIFYHTGASLVFFGLVSTLLGTIRWNAWRKVANLVPGLKLQQNTMPQALVPGEDGCFRLLKLFCTWNVKKGPFSFHYSLLDVPGSWNPKRIETRRFGIMTFLWALLGHGDSSRQSMPTRSAPWIYPVHI